MTLLLAVAGGCSSGPVHQSYPECDGDTGPPPLPLTWSGDVAPLGQGVNRIAGAALLPTGVAILVPPDILLADTASGHLLAQAPWPANAAGLRAAIGRSSGDLALLVAAEPADGNELVLYDYSGTDLSLVKKTVVSDGNHPAALGELNGQLYVVETVSAASNSNQLILYSVSDDGSVTSRKLATGDSSLSVNGGRLLSTQDGRLLACGTRFGAGTPEMLRIDPATGAVHALPFSGKGGSEQCQIAGGSDRVLAGWAVTGEEKVHWEMLSADGRTLVDESLGAGELGPLTYGAGAFLSNIEGLYVINQSLDVNGPYGVVSIPTCFYHPDPSPQLAGDDGDLYVAYIGAGIELAKVGPLH